MKTSNVLTSLLLTSLAAAAPLDKRALVTKTEVVLETVVVYTTVWDGGKPAAEATPAPGGFYERPSNARPNPPVNTPKPPSPPSNPPAPPPPSPPAAPSSQYTPPAAPSPVYTPPPAPSSPPAPPPPPPPPAAPSSVYTPPAPAQPSQPSSGQPSGGQGGGETFTGDITIYDNQGDGACGKYVNGPDSMVAALAQDAWGISTHDVMTGAATNPWCGQKITVERGGNSVEVTIMDLCPTCKGHDIDLSLNAWNKLTNNQAPGRLPGSWRKSS